jgi:hypothetical protein
VVRHRFSFRTIAQALKTKFKGNCSPELEVRIYHSPKDLQMAVLMVDSDKIISMVKVYLVAPLSEMAFVRVRRKF